jgi:hypothetical protein
MECQGKGTAVAMLVGAAEIVVKIFYRRDTRCCLLLTAFTVASTEVGNATCLWSASLNTSAWRAGTVPTSE